jgi:hypothetical protein
MTPDNRAISGPYEAIPYASEQGIYFRPNRELDRGIRELFGRIREEALGSAFFAAESKVRRPRAIAGLGSYPSTPLAETPRPSRRR